MKGKICILLLSLIVLITPFFYNYSNLNRCSDMKEFAVCLERELPQLLTKYKIPAASISIIENAQVEWIGTFENERIVDQSKIDKDTLFQVASISKSVTALGIMKLVEQGKIELDAPIDKYVTRWKIPKSIYDIKQVTVRRLLSHTSGFSNGGGYQGYSPYKSLPSIEESLNGIEGKAKPVELICEPGTKYIYSGGGYVLLQLLIEEVTGIDFNEYMKIHVLKPAHMTDSSFQWEESMHSRTAKAYDKDLNQIPNYLYVEEAAAGLYTTIDDISQFLISEINSFSDNGIGNLLDMETMKQVYTPIMEISSQLGNGKAALGHFIDEPKAGIELITNNGSNRGWRANFTINPNEKTGIAILTNGDNGNYLINEVLDIWYAVSLNAESSISRIRYLILASTYSISFFLILWSAISLYLLMKGIKKGNREMTLLNNKYTFVLKCFICILLMCFTYIFKTNISSILSFADPNIENVIFIGLLMRVVVGISQIVFGRTRDTNVDSST